MNALLAKIEARNPVLNAYITVLAEQALREAQVAEEEIAAGAYRGPMHGIPVSLKDLIYTAGIRTTAGSVILQDFVPDHDATVTARLKKAGAILIAKANMLEFAYGEVHPDYGPACNPWNHWLRNLWFEQRIGRGGRCGARFRVARIRYRRLDPVAGCLLRHRGVEADLRAGQPLWRRAIGLVARPCRPHDANGSR